MHVTGFLVNQEIDALGDQVPPNGASGDLDIDGEPIREEDEWETDSDVEEPPSDPPPTKPTGISTDHAQF